MTTIRLTAAQAMVRWLSVQQAEDGSRFIEGVWAIFGHGNVAGIGEALHAHKDVLPTYRGQNEQTMAHAAIALNGTNVTPMTLELKVSFFAPARPGRVFAGCWLTICECHGFITLNVLLRKQR